MADCDDTCAGKRGSKELLVIEKILKQARHRRVRESRFVAKESNLGDPILDIEWHTAPLLKKCYCPAEPCVCKSHLMKEGNLPYCPRKSRNQRKLNRNPGTFIPKFAATVEADMAVSTEMSEDGQLCATGPEFCTSNCNAFTAPIHQSNYYSIRKKLIDKYIRLTKLDKKKKLLLTLKNEDLTAVTKDQQHLSSLSMTEEEGITPRAVPCKSVCKQLCKFPLTEKDEIQELKEIMRSSRENEKQSDLESKKNARNLALFKSSNEGIASEDRLRQCLQIKPSRCRSIVKKTEDQDNISKQLLLSAGTESNACLKQSCTLLNEIDTDPQCESTEFKTKALLLKPSCHCKVNKGLFQHLARRLCKRKGPIGRLYNSVI